MEVLNVLQTTMKATRTSCIPPGFVGGIFFSFEPIADIIYPLCSVYLPLSLSFSNTPFLFSFIPSLQLHESGIPLPRSRTLSFAVQTPSLRPPGAVLQLWFLLGSPVAFWRWMAAWVGLHDHVAICTFHNRGVKSFRSLFVHVHDER